MSISGRISTTTTTSFTGADWFCIEWFLGNEYAIWNELFWTRLNLGNTLMTCGFFRLSSCLGRDVFAFDRVSASVTTADRSNFLHPVFYYYNAPLKGTLRKHCSANKNHPFSDFFRTRLWTCQTRLFTRVIIGARSSYHRKSSHLMDTSWRSYFTIASLSRKHSEQQLRTANCQFVPAKQIKASTHRHSRRFLCSQLVEFICTIEEKSWSIEERSSISQTFDSWCLDLRRWLSGDIASKLVIVESMF